MYDTSNYSISDLAEQGSLRLQIARSCDRVAAGTWI